MRQIFDYYKKPKKRYKILCNPDGTQLYSLGVAQNVTYRLRYNSMSEMSFDIPKHTQDGEVECYEDIKTKRRIIVEDIGIFVITNVAIVGDGVKEKKSVTCKTLEYELSRKVMTVLDGTYKFFDPLDISGTIMGEIMSYLPNWKIGDIDSDLWALWRTFDVVTNNVYSFMMNDVEKAYQCVFEFDTFNRTISAKTAKKAVKKTSIMLSYNNLLKDMKVDESEEEFVTCLSVFGGGDLNIRLVNPLGTPNIYNFDYYISQGWMNEELEKKVILWQEKVNSKQAIYADKLTQLKTNNADLISLNTQLEHLKGELKTFELKQSVMIEGNQVGTSEYSKLLTDIENKKNEITAKENAITSKGSAVESIKGQLTEINKELAFESNFTPDMLKQLDGYINASDYTDEHFIYTSEMTDVEVQETAQELMDQGKTVLSKVCQPKYKFSVSMLNFLALVDYKAFSDEVDLGCELNVAMGGGFWSYPVLLEMSFNEDKPSELNCTFGNSLRLNSDDFSFQELFGESVKASNQQKVDSPKWNEWVKSGANQEWADFKNSIFDASQKELANSSNQDILFDQTGLKFRKLDPATEVFDPKQMWMINNGIYMTKDNWQNLSTVLGELTLPSGQKVYGLSAEVLIGDILIGSELKIENETGSFQVTGDKVLIKNASIIMTNDDGKDTTIEDYISSGDKNISNNLNNAIDKVYDDMISMEEAIMDGVIETYYQDAPPSNGKIGDLWFNTSTGKLYRHNANLTDPCSMSCWDLVEDSKITEAIKQAQGAQETADGKITSYYQTEEPKGTPTKPLSEGDLWIDTNDGNKLYRFSVISGKFVEVQDKRFDAIANDLSQAIIDINKTITDFEIAVNDGMIETFYQTGLPTGKIGDLWFKTDTGKLYRHNGKVIEPCNMTCWDLVEDAKITEAIEQAQNAQSTADGKITSYYQTAPPTGTSAKPLGEGDLWIDTDNGNLMHRYSESTRTWIAFYDKKIDQVSGNLSDAINKVYEDMPHMMEEAIADGAIDIFYEKEKPAPPKHNPKIGDLWVDIDDNQFWRYDGATWSSIQDKSIQDALSQAQDAQSTADGKITSFYQPNIPQKPDQNPKEGDLWIDIDNGNLMHRYSESTNSWIPFYDKQIDGVQENLNNAVNDLIADIKAVEDGVIETYYTASIPTAGKLGDLWFKSDTGRLYRHNGGSAVSMGSWDLVEDKALTDAVGQAQTTADSKISSFYETEKPMPPKHNPKDGDLWIDIDDNNKLHRYDGTKKDWIDCRDKTIATVSKDLGDRITDLNNQVGSMEEAIADGMIEVFYQPNTPQPPNQNPKNGDLWYNTTRVDNVPLNEASIYQNGWVKIQDKTAVDALAQAGTAQDTADGKITSFYNVNPPQRPEFDPKEGDLWVDTDNGNLMHRYSESTNSWIAIQDGAIKDVNDNLSGAIEDVNNKVTEIESAIADGMVEIFYQSEKPVKPNYDPKDGDLWYNTGKKNEACIYKSGEWITIQDKNIIDALDNANKAQSTADGKITCYYLAEPPVGTSEKPLGEGDLWIDIDDNNYLYTYKGGKWVEANDTSYGFASNIIVSSKPESGESRGWFFDNSCGIYTNPSNGYTYYYGQYPSTGERYITSKNYSCNPNTWYTVAFDYASTNGGATSDIFILSTATQTDTTLCGGAYEYIDCHQVLSGNGRKVYSFLTNSNSKSFFIRFDANGNSGGGEMQLTNIKLERGKHATEYSKCPTEKEFYKLLEVNNTANDAINKVENVVLPSGELDTSKMYGQIMTGKNNIWCIDPSNSRALILNEWGLSIANSKSGSNWNWRTAITADGVYADNVTAGANLNSVNIRGSNISGGVITGDAQIALGDKANDSISYEFSKGKRLMIYNKHRICVNIGSDFEGKKEGYLTCQHRDDSTSGSGIIRQTSYTAYGTRSLNEYEIDANNVQIAGTLTSVEPQTIAVPTQSHGNIIMYSQDSDRPYLETKGLVDVLETVRVDLSEEFLATIEPNRCCPYHIQLTPYANARVWIEEVGDTYFIIGSDKPCKVSYSLSGTRYSYAMEHGRKVEITKAQQKRYEAQTVQRMTQMMPEYWESYYELDRGENNA